MRVRESKSNSLVHKCSHISITIVHPKSWFVLKSSNHQQLQISFNTGVVPDKELPGWRLKYHLTASERMLMKKGASFNECAVGRSCQ